MADKKDRLEITELFMAQASIDRRFYGTISRGYDSSGHPVVRARIEVNTGFVIAMAGNQDALGERLDEMVLMVLDYGLHSDAGKTVNIAGTPFFLN